MIGLNVAVGVAAVAIFAGVTLIPRHTPDSVSAGLGEPTVVVSAEGISAPASGTSTNEAPAAEQFSFAGAGQDQCSAEGSIQSAALGPQVTFSFENETSQAVQIIWLNYQGSSVPYATLPPGETYSVNTTIGNVWMIASTAQSCLGIFSIRDTGQISVSE